MTSESEEDNPPTSTRGQNKKLFFHRAHQEQKRAAKTAGKGGYTATVQKIYSATPPSLEEYHEVIEYIQTIVQGM